MGAFLKKDLLLFWRDRRELLLLLLMPFLLICILGLSWQSLMGSSIESLDMKVAVVQEDDESQGLEQFLQQLEETPLPADAPDFLIDSSMKYKPILLLNQMLQQEEVQELVETVEMDAAAAEKALAAEEVVAILHIPSGFTYQFLSRIMLDEGKEAELTVKVTDYAPMRAEIFAEMIDSFVRTYNFESALGRAAGTESLPETMTNVELSGSRETVSKEQPVTSFQYYTVAMTAMFVLYVASAVANKAFIEKEQRAFDRILLAGSSPIRFLGAKMLSGTWVSWTQIMLLFTLSQLIFRSFPDRSYLFWFGLAFIAVFLSLLIGALGAALTSINFMLDSQKFSQFFGMALVSMLAFIGGSLAPAMMLPEWLNEIGTWTPNGLFLSSFLQWLQGETIWELTVPLVKMLTGAVVLMGMAMLMFPRRGRA